MTPDPLSIPFLLGQIQTAELDSGILADCQRAELLSRRKPDDALRLMQATLDVAVRIRHASTTGIAFLYQAVVRHRLTDKRELDQARVDGDTALKWLKNDPHHLMLGQLVCASLCHDDEQFRLMLKHLREADELAAKLAEKWHRRNIQVKEKGYLDLRESIAETRKKVSLVPRSHPPLADLPDTPPTRAAKPPAEPTIELWPGKVRKVNLQAITTDTQSPPSGRASVGHLWVDDQRYRVEPLDPTLPTGQGMHLIPGQTYTVIEVATPNAGPKRYLLVRQQAQADKPGQYVIVTGSGRTWTEVDDDLDFQADLRVIGAAEPGAPIFGVAEALLTPEPEPPETPHSAATPALQSVSDKIDQDLLFCVDTFVYASRQQPALAADLKTIQNQFEKYLERRWGLLPIPITPGVTLWDAALGHKPIGQIQRFDLPDGVIVEVLRNGYTLNGRVVREANVIVNHLPTDYASLPAHT